MNETLTGQAAADAISVYAGLGALNARFDGRKVAKAVRDVRARARLLASVRVSHVRSRIVRRPLALRATSRRASSIRTRQSSTRRAGRIAPPSDPHLARESG